MDPLLPVFQLVYFVVHFLYSLAQSVVSTWHLLTAMMPIFHNTPQYASRATDMPLAKTPRHLGVIVSARDPNAGSLAALLAHAASYGVRYLSLYDVTGDVMQRREEVLLEAGRVAGGAYTFTESGENGEKAEETERKQGGREPSREKYPEKSCGSPEKSGGHENAPTGGLTSDGDLQGPGKNEKAPENSDEGPEKCQEGAESSGKGPGSDLGSPEKSGDSPEKSCASHKTTAAPQEVSVRFMDVRDGRHTLAAAARHLSERYAMQVKGQNTTTPPQAMTSDPDHPSTGVRQRHGAILREFPKVSEIPADRERLKLEYSHGTIPGGREHAETPPGTSEHVKTQFPSLLGLGNGPTVGLPTSRDISQAVCLGLPDPELVVTLGLYSTLGYPPWMLRASEIHFLNVSETCSGLSKIMEAYAGCEQRWGR